MKIHLDVKDNNTEESFAVEVKVGNHHNYKTFNFKHEAILFTDLDAAFSFAHKLQELNWNDDQAILIENIDLPFFTVMLLKEYEMLYLYKSDFLVRKVNIAYSFLSDAELRKATIGLVLKEI